MSDFGKNLKYLRKKNKISQSHLASILNYGYTAISNYEQKRNEPSYDDLIKIADFFNISIDALIGHEIKIVPDNKNLKYINENFSKLSAKQQYIFTEIIKLIININIESV